MKTIRLKTISLACLILLALAAPLTACPPDGPQIRVFGESETTIAPDHAVVTLRMENKAQSLGVAEKLHKKVLGIALNALKALNITDRDVRASGPWMGTGNTLASTLTVTVIDLDRLSSLVQALSNKPNTTVEKIAYSHTRLAQLTQETRTRALLDAKAKALSMTRVLETPLGRAVYIQETESAVSANPAGPGTPGIRIKKKIEVVFRLGSKKA